MLPYPKQYFSKIFSLTLSVGFDGPLCVFCWYIKFNIFKWDLLYHFSCNPSSFSWLTVLFVVLLFFPTRLGSKLWSHLWVPYLFHHFRHWVIFSPSTISWVFVFSFLLLDSEVPDFWIRIQVVSSYLHVSIWIYVKHNFGHTTHWPRKPQNLSVIYQI